MNKKIKYIGIAVIILALILPISVTATEAKTLKGHWAVDYSRKGSFNAVLENNTVEGTITLAIFTGDINLVLNNETKTFTGTVSAYGLSMNLTGQYWYSNGKFLALWHGGMWDGHFWGKVQAGG